MITWNDFEKIDFRAGTIRKVEPFLEAKKPAFKVWIDFGAVLGVKKSSAQLTANYQAESLVGRQVVCIVSFKPKQIANFISEVLITGFPDAKGEVVLTTIDKEVPDGAQLF